MGGIANFIIAVAAAARILLGRVGKVLNDPRAPANALSEAIVPIFGIRWNAEVRRRTGGINNALCRLRNSVLPRMAILNYEGSLRKFRSPQGLPPPNWGEWLSIIEKFELDNVTKHPEWAAVIFDFRGHWVRLPNGPR